MPSRESGIGALLHALPSHADLFLPEVWHEQRHGGICDACHLDLDQYWRVYGATKQAALINEEETNLEKSTKPIEGVLLTIASIPLQFVPFLSFLGYGLLLNWLRRRFSQ